MLVFFSITSIPVVFAQTLPTQAGAERSRLVSDVLIVIDSDGRSHTVQHTMATSGPELTLQLPGSVIPHEVLFFGPEQQIHHTQYNKTPSTLVLSSGSALARYQHQYGLEVEQPEPGLFVLSTTSVPENMTVKEGTLRESSVSWVLPNDFDIVSYSIADENAGRWELVNNTLTFKQVSTEASDISISYRKRNTLPPLQTPACSELNPPSDECAEDNDEDGIPDYRDICHAASDEPSNQFGCVGEKSLILEDIEFAAGRTYLDLTARTVLDRAARAILRSDYKFYEIAGHTDDHGATKRNQQLSRKRADAVRHYLILKGVSPNALRASGYGEQYPIRENDTVNGRRANRRIELVVIQ